MGNYGLEVDSSLYPCSISATFFSESCSDFARALTGQPLISPVIDTKVSAWQSIGKKTAPKVVRLQSGGIAIKVVINHWELAEDV